ncbi:MAG: prohibitin family protein [Bacteroidetes bacterium]|nr:MAG: prohibitin family protein [Bacteroidota bacterium]TNE96392.1 MAG: prohibitin family protein [Bacteroidota bacterium]
MSNFNPQIPKINIDPKKIGRYIVLGVIGLILFIMFLMSWTDVDPGEQGFIYRPYGGGVDKNQVYDEGTIFIAPWNEMIKYNIRQQSKNYVSEVMDINGTDITVKVAVNYAAQKGKIAQLHLKHGPGFISFIDDKAKGAIKDVIGRYTYEQVYSSKREALEGEIESILQNDFKGNYITLYYVEIADVNLPSNIAQEITNKETQKQRNLTAKEKQKEQEYLANALIEKARGDSALVISARFKAEAIQLEAEQIARNPQYIELKKWEKWDGVGSPYGEGNVFGSGVSILKSGR